MGLKGKMIGQTEIKAGGDVFHDIIKMRPHELSKMSPDKVKAFTLLEGELGKVGSKICWHYTHDGKDCVGKEIIEDIDEEKQSVRFKLIEGDLMEIYKSMYITYHVDTNGPDSLVTWTLEYEKLKEEYPHPGTVLSFFLHMVEDIESHHS
ncbi:hypothetical protein M9H77_08837 [Catharanthus roseus]|uniref:Uncharacterized protein n=1 Tax=Catharanthus roseus TaxID=4058 RepID=A0ACC0BYT7_CATRO|nr:hypothetical protein M9H77_08837 [Catharanthus roseus]